METKMVIWLVAVALLFCCRLSGEDVGGKTKYPVFHIGATGIQATIEKGQLVTVESIAAASPASGQLAEGDILTSVNGVSLKFADPRVVLGRALTQAEGSDGKLAFTVRRGGDERTASIAVPVLGAYGSQWPLDCRKSDTIIRQAADFVVTQPMLKQKNIQSMLAVLFLLSTDDPKYMPTIVEFVHRVAAGPTPADGSCWPRGYEGILMAEYYLKTGDATVLPGLKTLCDGLPAAQIAGGWAHGGLAKNISGGYVQSALINPAGVPILTAIILARECGVEVDETMYRSALTLFYRMAGHGNVCYGDHRPELMWPCTNGKNGMLACALSLIDSPVYQEASRHMAVLMADSYYSTEFGHTGGGFNVIWRGLGSVHVPESRQANYRRQMDELSWYYDLCRLPGGGFSMPPSPPDTTRYSGVEWGTGGIGLAYTAPRRTLRICGAPPGKYSHRQEAPVVWGNPADRAFLRTDYADGFGAEELTPLQIHDTVLKGKGDLEPATCAKYLRHYSPMVRIWASRRLGSLPEAIAVIATALKDPDVRVRRAGLDCISQYDNWNRNANGILPAAIVSEQLLPLFEPVLNDDKASLWEVDGALYALARALPADIRRNLPAIRKYAAHGDWYLRESAFWAIVGLHGEMKADEFQFLVDMYGAERHVFPRSSYNNGFTQLLKRDKLVLDAAELQPAAQVFGRTLHSAPIVEGTAEAAQQEFAHRTMMCLRAFQPGMARFMIPDVVRYLKAWEPYYQHSVWMISGSNWQDGILPMLDSLGEDARPIAVELKRIETNYGQFTKVRSKEEKAIPGQIHQALEKWEAKYGALKQ